MAAAADPKSHGEKIALANYYAARVLPQAYGLAGAIKAGAAPIMALAHESF